MIFFSSYKDKFIKIKVVVKVFWKSFFLWQYRINFNMVVCWCEYVIISKDIIIFFLLDLRYVVLEGIYVWYYREGIYVWYCNLDRYLWL